MLLYLTVSRRELLVDVVELFSVFKSVLKLRLQGNFLIKVHLDNVSLIVIDHKVFEHNFNLTHELRVIELRVLEHPLFLF